MHIAVAGTEFGLDVAQEPNVGMTFTALNGNKLEIALQPSGFIISTVYTPALFPGKVLDVTLENTDLTEEEIRAILDPIKLTTGGIEEK